MDNIHVKFENVGEKLIISQAEELKPKYPLLVVLNGVITSPGNYIEQRIEGFQVDKSHLIVNRKDMTLKLVVNEADPLNTANITGSLTLHADFKKFKINSGETWSAVDLSDFIKMNRSFFTSKEVAAKLVKQLREFKAKVNNEIELKKDDRANYDVRKAQVVNSNLPEAFTIVVPMFVGQDKQSIPVEINIHPDTLECQLCSPDANDILIEYKEQAINEQLERIKTLVPKLLIIEV